jgi:8-oxo-dGTP pyrophosphatase MutT (NUDIX family)
VDLPLRQAVRGLLIDPSDRILLMQVRFDRWGGWLLPGGGLEAGEDHLAALHRELAEETGIPQVFVGPPLWRRRHVRPGLMAGYSGQEELVFLVPCHAFEVAPTMSAEELRTEGVVGHRWWTSAELAETTDDLRPHNLAELVARVLEHGAPSAPLLLEEIYES